MGSLQPQINKGRYFSQKPLFKLQTHNYKKFIHSGILIYSPHRTVSEAELSPWIPVYKHVMQRFCVEQSTAAQKGKKENTFGVRTVRRVIAKKDWQLLCTRLPHSNTNIPSSHHSTKKQTTTEKMKPPPESLWIIVFTRSCQEVSDDETPRGRSVELLCGSHCNIRRVERRNAPLSLRFVFAETSH